MEDDVILALGCSKDACDSLWDLVSWLRSINLWVDACWQSEKDSLKSLPNGNSKDLTFFGVVVNKWGSLLVVGLQPFYKSCLIVIWASDESFSRNLQLSHKLVWEILRRYTVLHHQSWAPWEGGILRGSCVHWQDAPSGHRYAWPTGCHQLQTQWQNPTQTSAWPASHPAAKIALSYWKQTNKSIIIYLLSLHNCPRKSIKQEAVLTLWLGKIRINKADHQIITHKQSCTQKFQSTSTQLDTIMFANLDP